MAKRDEIEPDSSEEEDIDIQLEPDVQKLAQRSKEIEAKIEVEKDKRQHFESDIKALDQEIEALRIQIFVDSANEQISKVFKSRRKKRMRKKRALNKVKNNITKLREQSAKLNDIEDTGEEPPHKRQKLNKNTMKENENNKLKQIVELMSQLSPKHKQVMQKFAKSQNLTLEDENDTQDTQSNNEEKESAQQTKPKPTQTIQKQVEQATEMRGQTSEVQVNEDEQQQIESIFKQTGVKLSSEELKKTRVQLAIHKLKKDMEDTKLCPYQFEGASSETDERILEFRRKFCDWFDSNSKKQGFDEVGAIEKILRFNVTKSAQKKLNEDDLKTIKSKKAFLKWFDTHYPLEKLRDIKYHQVYKYSFAASLKAGSVMTGYKRLIAEMESITEGILPAKIENLSFKQTEKVDLLIAAIKRSNKEMHDLLISKTIMNEQYPQTLDQLQQVLLSIEKYLQESKRSQLMANDPTKIGTRTVNAITKEEFGLDEFATSANSSYGTRNDTYKNSARGSYGNRNVFGRGWFRGARGARGARGRRGNRGGRARFRGYRSRFTYGNRLYNKPEYNTNVENINWSNQQQIRQFGANIERFRRKTIALQRMKLGDRAGMCALYQVSWDDAMLLNNLPKEFAGTCNKCRRWGHLGRHHELMVDVLPGLAELYATGQTKQVNLLNFKQLTQTKAFQNAVQAQALLVSKENAKDTHTVVRQETGLMDSRTKANNNSSSDSGAAFLERTQSIYN